MQSLKKEDAQAEFRFFGGDMMTAVGGTRVKHYKELAYMGFIPVLLHLPTIMRNMKMCQQDMLDWQPDVVILVDYPGFNLKIAKFVKANTKIPVYYYISPKIWAWKEYRIKNIKRDVDEMFSILPFEVDFFEKKHHYPIHYVGNPTAFSILPFEVDFFEKKHHYPIHYVGNPTAQEVRAFLSQPPLPLERKGGELPVIALLAGSRRQEIKDNLPAMIEATRHLAGQYDIVLAGAPGIEPTYYEQFLRNSSVRMVSDQTYPLLSQATAALVTSGTATLETAMFRVPQVVCYETPIPKVIAFLKKHLIKVRYISLVNLIVDREVVPELVADTFSVENIRQHLQSILPGGEARQRMLDGYEEVHRRLGDSHAPDVAARLICELLNHNKY